MHMWGGEEGAGKCKFHPVLWVCMEIPQEWGTHHIIPKPRITAGAQRIFISGLEEKN